MARRKIKIKRIENPTTRQVTFSKRRGGLLKKAHDLAVLCDAEVGVVIFSSKGKLFQFASPSMGSVLERYSKSCGDSKAPHSPDNVPNHHWSQKLKRLLSGLNGDDLEQLSLRDLIHLEHQLNNSLSHIHANKEELLLKHLEDFREKVTKARRTTNKKSSILEKLSDDGPSEITGSWNSEGQGGSEHHCLQEAPQTDASVSLRAETSDGQTCEGLPTAKRFLITEDLNKSPACNEE